ncbi:hypothetical protein DPMN_131676 [Dreissena polymorpha]|uniref:Uncharacterized protein n=1 Tax=Dreissena polymorpha TaxID=45954 RepID=A0A9D4FVE7_DREPO|nr:hypothetical protein DPMN_131676 [Dreissena polymorpha]
MARQRPTRRPRVGILEIDRIVIREVQYQLEVKRCRNEQIIVKVNFGWAWPMWAGRPRFGNGAMHKFQYQFEVNRCRNEEIIVKVNFGWAWPIWTGRPIEINCIVIREVQYQFEVNPCRNEEIIVKGNLGGRGLCERSAPGLVMGPCIAEIYRIVIREVQYQFEINRFKGNFGWAWPMWVGRLRVGNGAMHIQYQFKDNRCRNEEILFQGSNSGQDGRKTEITTIFPLFLRKAWG